MTVIARLTMTDGLHTGLGEAGQDHCADAMNVYGNQSRLKARLGMQAVEAVPGNTSAPWCGGGKFNTLPLTMSQANFTFPSLTDGIYVGFTSAFNRAVIYGNSFLPNSPSAGAVMFPADLVWEYWNGTVWTALPQGSLWVPAYDAANDTSTTAPWIAYDTNSLSVTAIAAKHINVVFDPPSDWTSRTLGGVGGLYVIRVRGLLTGTTLNGATFVAASSSVQTTENQVLHINCWKDRAGAAHRLVVFLYGTAGDTLKWMLDGVVLTPDSGLAPASGTDSGGASYVGQMFNPNTEVTSVYHAGSDRVIGCVAGFTWFYLIPGNGNVYTFVPDPVGANTPYATLPAGRRAALPLTRTTIIADGRIWAVDGEKILWSSPGAYPDIWPNQNELLLSDPFGPITGLALTAGSLTVFKRGIVYSLQSDGSADGYDAVPHTGGFGAVGGGITACGNETLFVSPSGLYMFDGSAFTRISSAIDELFFRNLIGSDLSKAKSVFYGPLNQWRIFYPSISESYVKDAAFYVDLTGRTEESQGEATKKVIPIWPQGKYVSTDYGFQMTAVALDETGPTRRVLCGDRYGVTWEMDKGLLDGGTAVKARAIQAPMNVGHSQQIYVRQVTTMWKDMGSVPYTVEVIPNTRRDHAKACTSNPHKNGVPKDAALADPTALANATAVANASAEIIARESNFATRCRLFQIGILKAVLGEMECVSIEVEGNAAGRRAEP